MKSGSFPADGSPRREWKSWGIQSWSKCSRKNATVENDTVRVVHSKILFSTSSSVHDENEMEREKDWAKLTSTMHLATIYPQLHFLRVSIVLDDLPCRLCSRTSTCNFTLEYDSLLELKPSVRREKLLGEIISPCVDRKLLLRNSEFHRGTFLECNCLGWNVKIILGMLRRSQEISKL